LKPIFFNVSCFDSGKELRASTHRSFGASGCFAGFSSAGTSAGGLAGGASAAGWGAAGGEGAVVADGVFSFPSCSGLVGLGMAWKTPAGSAFGNMDVLQQFFWGFLRLPEYHYVF
jgi:hypothetical protein